jgi:hypothetical protein
MADDPNDCLHCEINALVEQRLAEGKTDLTELGLMVVESLAELILLAPENEQSKMMADVLAHFGHAYLEKSGAIAAGGSSATH